MTGDEERIFSSALLPVSFLKKKTRRGVGDHFGTSVSSCNSAPSLEKYLHLSSFLGGELINIS
jgi:hypothetical protein